MRILFTIFLILGFYGLTVANPFEQDSISKKDSTVGDFFRRGNFYGHSRYFFMSTDNAFGLDDYFANAFGLGIGYETPKFKNFSVGISGYFIYNLGSSDLKKSDSLSGLPNRYEVGLFDVENPNNHADLDRLEDLYLRYGNERSFIRLGKQHFNSPFINPQDGRMRPTLVEGIYTEWNEWKNWKFHNSLIWDISPRSTVRWYSVGESMGIYPAGLNPDGTKSGYAGNIESKWLLITGVQRTIAQSLKVQIWNQLVDNVFNTALFQADWNPKVLNKKSVYLVSGAQFIFQNSVNKGGNSNPSKTYFQHGAQTNVFSFRLGVEKKKKWSGSVNFTQISNDGRYLMPREWGRDPFYTFMPRERNEGFSGVKALNAKFSWITLQEKLRIEISAGRFILPDVKNAEANKYAMPSYDQFNLEIQYHPGGLLRDFNFQFLVVHKSRLGEVYDTMRFVHNKVNMTMYNLVLNFHF